MSAWAVCGWSALAGAVFWLIGFWSLAKNAGATGMKAYEELRGGAIWDVLSGLCFFVAFIAFLIAVLK